MDCIIVKYTKNEIALISKIETIYQVFQQNKMFSSTQFSQNGLILSLIIKKVLIKFFFVKFRKS